LDIQDSPSGQIIKSSKGYNAFLPNPLPPSIKWDNNLVTTLSRADFVLGKLAREGSRLPNPHLLLRPFITREAVLSSKIEGIHATIGEILAHNAGIQVKQDPNDLQEVQNYIAALDFGLKRLNELPLSLRLIREIHEQLMKDVRGSHATPGEFRKSQNWIGPPGCTLNTAKFVPPPADRLLECLSELEQFLHNRQLPALIHVALCHYQFEAIHPFLDGNGRVGRLLVTLLLIEQNILPAPLLYLSAFFEATRDEYYKQLYNLSSTGNWNDWLIYFLNGIAVQSEDALSRAERINSLLDKWQLQVANTSSNIPVHIIQRFAVNPYLTINKIASELNIAYSTAQRGVEKLEANNIIKQIGDSKRDKVYCATEILSILEESAKINADLEK
jgi:cell filamentation protein, protein adenylyltransferase